MSLRVAVSDAGPLHYLILLEHTDILPHLFEKVLAPDQVRRELLHPNAPASVRAFISNPPAWLQFVEGVKEMEGDDLHSGEAAALNLAVESKSEILIDDHAGRVAAKSLGLQPIGTISLIERAAEKGLITFNEAVQKLQRTNFYFHPRLLEEALRRQAKE